MKLINIITLLLVGFVLGIYALDYVNKEINQLHINTIISEYQEIIKIKKEIIDRLRNAVVTIENKQMVIDIKNRQMQLLRVENEALRYIINDDPKIKSILKKR